jgi:hypothetical protein
VDLVVAQGVVEKPAKRTGAVERGIDEGGILREHIQPVGHLVIGVASSSASSGRSGGCVCQPRVVEKGAGFLGGGRHADDVEVDAAEKRRVAGDGSFREMLGS